MSSTNSNTTTLCIGGVVAIGFDASNRLMLVFSHSGSGLYEIGSWQLIARDHHLNYPENGIASGIGPIDGEKLSVQELDYNTGTLQVNTPDNRYKLYYESGALTITAIP